jgi:hypothetical protein
LPRGQQFDVALVIEGPTAAGDPLCKIDQVGGDIGDALALNRDIENPGWPPAAALPRLR